MKKKQSQQLMALALDPSLLLTAQGFAPDPWQEAVLAHDGPLLLNCCRSAGKSTVAGAKAMGICLTRPKSLVLAVSRSQRQAGEIVRKAKDAYFATGSLIPLEIDNRLTLELANGSRIVSLPSKEDTVRCYNGVSLLINDESARIPDELHKAVSPMVATSGGSIWDLSTPFGRRGMFFKQWHDEEYRGKKIKISAAQCKRLTPEFLAAERRKMGDDWYAQEYDNSFTKVEGLIYSEFPEAVVDFWPIGSVHARKIGGIDWGWANPFAAVWGHYEPLTDVLYITNERYLRNTRLDQHADALRVQNVLRWYADPAGAREIAEMRAAGLTVLKGDNEIEAGIACVKARLQTNRLKIHRDCVCLIDEASMYRRNEEGNIEDEYNHALGALRYLISKLDARYMARYRQTGGNLDQAPPPEELPTRRTDTYDVWKDEHLWTSVN